ncbi:J domain-containing protein [Pseudogemmobacter faecipullorum]|uniref:J domain-containing protein n=1 Tax=Pseudogemmobacter faecipullorum TaxID=2755041 RepID=A0ABS8CIL9_9RHOB|nr:J domain-containing protein [Pseudogemmobacter faecipullorum]MCB5409239.1 J domain-containing protein [Pseudogemmobacter faecipullorum]
MVNKNPLNFDLRVSTDKKRKSAGRRAAGVAPSDARGCDYPNCDKPGQFRAPKSREQLEEFFWFCKDHIREYNLKWNFFDGTSDEEFRRIVEKDRLWERETKPFSKKDDGNSWARMGVRDPLEILGEKGTLNPGNKPVNGATRKLPPTERRALEILDSRDSMTKPEIRKQYKALIKVLHPDMNGGDRSQEEMLQEVVWAWDQIKDSRYFRD